MWRLLFLAVLVEVSCYAIGDLFDDSDGLWLFGEDENTGVTSQRLTNVLENLDHRAFPEYELDANWDDDEDSNVSGDDDDEDGNVSGDDDDEDGNVSGDDDDEGGATSASAENNVNVRDLADLVHDIERHLRLEPTPADLEIDDRGNDLGGSGGSKYDDTLDNGSTSAGDQAMEYRDENGGRLAPTVSVAARTKPVDGPVVSKRRRRTRPVSPYARIRQELQRIAMLLFAQRAGLMNPRVKFGQPAMIPDYFYNYTITDEVYDEIDYNAARSQIEDTVRNAIQEESDPKELVFVRLAPVLYKLRSGCTVNLLQRLVSAGLNRWTQTTALQIAKQRNFGLSVKYMIMSEINRTVFGNEFKKFEGVLDFMAQALAKNNTTSPAEFVFNMSSYILQCTPRSAFLENFIGRTRNLRSGLLNASPIAFTIRLLRAAPRPCTSLKPAQLFHSRLSMVKRVLRPIQKQLRSFLQAVYHALIHGRDDRIENIFPGYLEPNELALLRKVLGMLRAEGPASETISPAASPARRSYNRKREKETTYLQRLLKRLV